MNSEIEEYLRMSTAQILKNEKYDRRNFLRKITLYPFDEKAEGNDNTDHRKESLLVRDNEHDVNDTDYYRLAKMSWQELSDNDLLNKLQDLDLLLFKAKYKIEFDEEYLTNADRKAKANMNMKLKVEETQRCTLNNLVGMSWDELHVKNLLEELKSLDSLQFQMKYKERYGIEYIFDIPGVQRLNTSKTVMGGLLKKENYNLGQMSWGELHKKGLLAELKASDIELFKTKYIEEFNKDYKG